MFGKINWDPTKREIRYFAVTLLIAAVVFSSLLLALGKYRAAGWLGGVGAFLSLVGYIVPTIGRLIYFLWMGVTYVLGRIVSPIVIAIIFYLVVTPMGVIMRIGGKDALRLKKPKGEASYFVDYRDETNKESFGRQF